MNEQSGHFGVPQTDALGDGARGSVAGAHAHLVQRYLRQAGAAVLRDAQHAAAGALGGEPALFCLGVGASVCCTGQVVLVAKRVQVLINTRNIGTKKKLTVSKQYTKEIEKEKNRAKARILTRHTFLGL